MSIITGDTEAVSGVDVAKALGQNPENVILKHW